LQASFFNEAAIALYILDCSGTDNSGKKSYPVEGLGETFVRYAGEGEFLTLDIHLSFSLPFLFAHQFRSVASSFHGACSRIDVPRSLSMVAKEYTGAFDCDTSAVV